MIYIKTKLLMIKKIKSNKFLFINIISSIILGVGSYFVVNYVSKNKSAESKTPSEQTANMNNCRTKRINNNNYKFTKPILLLESECECESQVLSPIKNEILSLIKFYQNKGVLDNASVYLKDMDYNEWVSVNSEKGYSPGSLMKVPLAITLMRLVEMKKVSLEQRLTVNQHSFVGYHQTYEGKIIEPNKSYTVKELLKYVLAYSDNNATNMLHQVVDQNLYGKVFDELKIQKPIDGKGTYVITPKDFSTFMRVLYNGTYIGRTHSDMILQMMSESSFTQGMAAAVDSVGFISHKFGESTRGSMHQLHESGIVYVNNTAYVITVMTEGKDIKQLPEVIKEISKVSYNLIKAGTTNNIIARVE